LDSQTLQYVEILNRLKRGTVEGKVLWEKTGSYGHQFAAPLEGGHRALVANISPPGGGQGGVLFTMSNAEGVQTLYLDSSRVTEDLLRLALLQLFVTVRDTLAKRVTDAALNAVKDL
jgi:hypothetical protein